MRASEHTVRALVAMALTMLLARESAFAQSRGELLYATHCSACHTSQIHWRTARTVTDWPSLVAQVRKWQDAAALGWTNADISDVAHYLNDNVYHYEHAAEPLTWLQPDPPGALTRRLAVESTAAGG